MELRRSRGALHQGFHVSTHQPNLNPTLQPVTEAPEQPKIAATGETARPQKPEPKSTAVPKLAVEEFQEEISREYQKRVRDTHNTRPGGPNTNSHLHNRGNLRSPQSPSPPGMREADSSARQSIFLPKGAARPRAVLKTVIRFVGEYGGTP